VKLPKPSQYPKELTINGISWRIVFVDQIQGKDVLGLCDSENKTIQLKRRQSPRERMDTFIHECIHALEYSYGFELNHNHVYKLAEGLADILIINF
jgi:hypothetical protein